MTTASIGKIILKNTTKISLNERFTAYRQQAQNTATFRQKSLKQASFENTKLAQQMARRPTVIAALRLKRRSLQQRLGQMRNMGGGVKTRLDFGSRNDNIHRRLGMTRGRSFARNRGGYHQQRPARSPLLRLGGVRGNKFKRFHPRNQNIGGYRRGFVNYFGKQRRGRGRPQSGGRGRWNQRPVVPTKQELDTELDQYMAETKDVVFIGSNY